MNEEEQIELIQGPGQILKQARERAGLTTQQIADKIRLKKSLIEDIEVDNYDINISLTFIKGYLKLYAKHVDVPEADILVAFGNLNTQKKEPAKLQSFSRRIANQANDDKLMLVTYLILAVVIALVVIWWWQQSDVEDQPATETGLYQPETSIEEPIQAQPDTTQLDAVERQTSISIDAEPAIRTSVQSTAESLATSNAQRESIPAAVPEAKQTLEVAEAEPNQSEAQQLTETSEQLVTPELAEPVKLVFRFADDCWMSLTDATGEEIAYGVKVKGRVMPVSGIPPFVVTLGAPEVVQIQYADEDLNMDFITPGRIAKFTLPLAQ